VRSLATTGERRAAEELGRALRGVPPAEREAPLAKMHELAREYERIRTAMPRGRDRTNRMYEVLMKMRVLGVAARPWLAELAGSSAPGERLAAVAMLQTQPDAAYIQWLADRCVDEPRFVGFHAAGALFTAVRLYGESQRRALVAAIESAQRGLAEKHYVDAERDNVLAQALQEVGGATRA
jgi:hypothetical protein